MFINVVLLEMNFFLKQQDVKIYNSCPIRTGFFFISIKSKIIKFYKYQRIDVNVMINSFCEALKE